jgi:hypothetical protein
MIHLFSPTISVQTSLDQIASVKLYAYEPPTKHRDYPRTARVVVGVRRPGEDGMFGGFGLGMMPYDYHAFEGAHGLDAITALEDGRYFSPSQGQAMRDTFLGYLSDQMKAEDPS